jgi:undecaprenyl-diphosphatase
VTSAAVGGLPNRTGGHGDFIFAAICVVLLAALAMVVSSGRLTAVDTQGILALRADASPALTQVMVAASAIAHGRVAIPIALVAAALIYRLDGRASAVLYVVACATGEGVLLLCKAIVHHPRPVGISPKLTDAGYYSFPSGHAMLAVIIFGLGTWLLTQRAPRLVQILAMSAAIGFILLVGMSRVYLGAHWPSDVVGAFIGGSGWTAFCGGAAAATAGRARRASESRT